MGSQHSGLLCYLLLSTVLICSGEELTGLSYNRQDVHRRHLHCSQRAANPPRGEGPALQLDFTAFRRTFQLRLRRDASAFSEEFRVLVEDQNGSVAADLSHLYSGTLEGKTGTTEA
ncbi:hypothetical protein CRUP_020485 [Coryphaenoides rupestris]|nr:hypothetical protein CRUP_020485 [Coryphaenoides rupestris]